LTKAMPRAGKVLDDGDVAALFGLEMAEPANSAPLVPVASKKPRQSETPKAITAAAGKKKMAAKKDKLPRARTKSGNKQVAVVSDRNGLARPRSQRSA
jgi:hypothetical protein